jgi:hypothetical protein
VAVPETLLGVDASPQSTEIDVTVPSGSVAENVTVTSWPVLVGFGETLLMVTVGERSLIVSMVLPEPCPALFVAVTVIVKVAVLTLPVDE